MKILDLLKQNPRIDATERASLLGVTENTEFILHSAEVRELYSLSAKVEGHGMQGYAMHGGIIFQCYDAGYCATYKLETGEKIAEFHLGSFYPHNHCGNAAFGTQYPEGNTEFPAMYVSGDLTTKACYVENVTTTGSELIQTIYFDIAPSYTGGQVMLDIARNRIVYMQRREKKIGDPDNIFQMCEFPIPNLSDGKEIHFTNADMLCEPYVLPFYSPYYQGATIDGKTILQTYGAFVENLFGSKTGVMYFDTETHELLSIMQLDGIIDKEPQGIFVHEGRIIACFAGGSVYEMKAISK